ncbi:src kinase-associated phosphoprotein 2 [Gastrophryne carolinensis]
MNQLPEDIRNIIADLDTFLSDTLKGENLSKKSKEKKENLIKKIKDIKLNYSQDFQDKGEFEDLDDEGVPHPTDNSSLASDRDKDDELSSEETAVSVLEKEVKGTAFILVILLVQLGTEECPPVTVTPSLVLQRSPERLDAGPSRQAPNKVLLSHHESLPDFLGLGNAPTISHSGLQFTAFTAMVPDGYRPASSQRVGAMVCMAEKSLINANIALTFAGCQSIPAQDLVAIKEGYLEKRRKDHNFFASEWQKRWCVLTKFIFYYYGYEKDKQQKGDFALDGYSARMTNTLRKDSKKDCCFEIFAPDKRIYQFTAPTPEEAKEWVNAILMLKDGEDGELYDDVTQAEDVSPPLREVKPVHTEEEEGDDIYEELPEENDTLPSVTEIPKPIKTPVSQTAPSNASGKETDYANYYRGLWDCTAEQADELSFKHGDVIYILSREYGRYGWWVGEMKGAIGLVPKAYIMEMYDI